MKARCSYCSEEMDWPFKQEPTSDIKHVCQLCSEMLAGGLSETDLKDEKKRKEVKMQIQIGDISGMMADETCKAYFEEFWHEDKEVYKTLSKHRVAEQAYFWGFQAAIASLLALMDEKELEKLRAEFEKEPKNKPPQEK